MKKPAADPSSALAERVREGASRHLHELREENAQLRALALRHREEHARLQSELTALLARSERSREEFVVVEEQNSKLASLFVSSSRLHETGDRGHVIEAIQEIVVNLIGSEELAILTPAADGSLRLEAGMGVDRAALERVLPGHGIIGRVATTGRRYVRDGAAQPIDDADAALTACVPLIVDDRLVGVVAIFGLLPQKAELEPSDYDLLDLLATQGALALDYTELRASRRQEAKP
jgi:hypothetical protein